MPFKNYLPTWIEDENVRTVRVVCSTKQVNGEGSNRSSNHWSIYLLLDEGYSARFNMKLLGRDRLQGTVELTHHDYHPTSALKRVDFACDVDVRVKDVRRMFEYGPLLTTGGFALRNFNYRSDFEGCRHWIHTAIAEFAEVEWLRGRAYSDLDPIIQRIYHTNGGSFRESYGCGYFPDRGW